mgnify:CR=1 FL=1
MRILHQSTLLRICILHPGKHSGGGCSRIVMKLRPLCMVYTANDLQKFANRSPKRITITLPYSTLEMLVKRSNEEGRSLSNLAAFILEQGINR